MKEYGINDWRNSVLSSDLTSTSKLVAMVLAAHYRPEKECYPSLLTIMELSSLKSKHTVIRAIRELAEEGFINIKKGKVKRLSALANCYEFIGVDNSASDGASDSASDGASDGAINAPEIREEENKGKREDKKNNQKEKIKFENVSDWESLFTYWEQNKQGGKYKNQDSRNRMLDKLKNLTFDDFEFAKDAIVFCIDNKYQGFTDGSRLYYRSSEAACGRKAPTAQSKKWWE